MRDSLEVCLEEFAQQGDPRLSNNDTEAFAGG